jgi:3',5'-cyclic AMP phosphodiesterase CpdA
MRPLWLVAALLPQTVLALAPHVTKGPVITGVTQSEAWISWETSVPLGKGKGCRLKGAASFTITPPVVGKKAFSDPTCGQIHHVHLTGMKADTRYLLTFPQRYDKSHAAGGDFVTAPADAKKSFKFIVYGDNRDAPPPQPQTRLDHEAVASAIRRMDWDAAFLLHTGDLALNLPIAADHERGYAEFFDIERAILASRPVYTVVGNHETIDMGEFDALVNPGSFEKSAHPYWSSYDWGRVHFTLVDSFEGPVREKGDREPGISVEQANWLDADLKGASERGQMIFLASHQSPFSHVLAGQKGHGGSTSVANVLVPLMLKYKVATIFAGHDHFYERGHEGCIDYFVVGSGGAPMYEPDTKATGVAVAKKQTAYVVVTVNDEGATAVAKGTTGEILDTFKLMPADAAPCQLNAATKQP